MAAGKQDLNVDQGADFDFTITIKDPSSGAAVDVTGWSMDGQIRETHQASAIVVSFTCSLVTPASGIVKAALTNTQTSALSPSKVLVYDIELTRTDNKKFRLLEGNVIVSPEVTR